MVVLNVPFAVLACICAALALPRPVEAAHLYGRQSTEKHTSVPHSQRLTRTRDSPFFGGSTAAQRHDDKSHGHQAQDHRASERPPLSRRYHVHDHNKVHDQQGQDPHDHAHHKVPRSAFARSRYRRQPVHLGRRSSVYVPGEHGNTYLVSRTPPKNWEHGRTDTGKQSSYVYNRRQVDESNLIMGRIDIMGNSQSPGSTQRLASLSVDPTPIDWTSGQNSAKAFPLNASTTNQTQFIMIPTDEQSDATGNSNKHVTLATEVFDASSADMVMYCATYDPDPTATSALLMTPCTGTAQLVAPATDSCTDDGNDASMSNPHESQIFSYDPSSGQVEPISATASSSGTGSDSNDLTPCAGARIRRDNGNSTTSGSVRLSSTSTSAAPTSASQQARNVTLVYVAGAPEVPAPSPSSSNTTNTTHASIGQAAALTTTVTTTVVAAVTTSETTNRTITPAQAAVSFSTSSIPYQSTTTAAPSAFTTATAARSSLSLLSSASAKTTSRPPKNVDESLEVEIVGAVPSTTTRSSSTSTTTATTTAHSDSSHSVSTSLDAQAVASSIAKKMVSRRAPIFASVTLTR